MNTATRWNPNLGCALGLISLLLLPATALARERLLVTPGNVYETEMDIESCDPADDLSLCQASIVDQRIVALSFLNLFSPQLSKQTTGRLFKDIKIEGANNDEEKANESNLVEVRFAGDFAYDGVLSFLSVASLTTVVPGVAQIVANFKVLDEQAFGGGALNANVVGSRNILTEALDLEVTDLFGADKRHTKKVKGSGAFDFAVQLERGRSYSILVELECLTQAISVESIRCDFRSDTAAIALPGLALSPITIAAADDSLERTLPQLDQIQDSTGDILFDTNEIKTNLDTALDDLVAIIGGVEDIDDDLMDFRTVFDEASARATAERQELNDLIKEVIRLLHVPTGTRTSEVDACDGEDCDFPARAP